MSHLKKWGGALLGVLLGLVVLRYILTNFAPSLKPYTGLA